MNSIEFTISGRPYTKKNHGQLIMVHGKPRMIPSKEFMEYQKNCKPFMPKVETIDYPVNVKAVYYLPAHYRCDLVNLHQALCDILAHYKVLKDDSWQYVASMDGSRVEFDKENPRTEVEITRKGER